MVKIFLVAITLLGFAGFIRLQQPQPQVLSTSLKEAIESIEIKVSPSPSPQPQAPVKQAAIYVDCKSVLGSSLKLTPEKCAEYQAGEAKIMAQYNANVQAIQNQPTYQGGPIQPPQVNTGSSFVPNVPSYNPQLPPIEAGTIQTNPWPTLGQSKPIQDNCETYTTNGGTHTICK